MGWRWLAVCGVVLLALVALTAAGVGAGGASSAQTAAAPGKPLPACAGVMSVTLDPLRDGVPDSRVVAASCSPTPAEQERDRSWP